ncbi:MAG: ComEA family DNA-binding protein [Corynebacterium sp.]|nr:ComEA family DNA-binding protein [Corynebacterium sp.]
MKKTKSIANRISEITKPSGAEDEMQVSYPKPRFSVKPIQVLGFLVVMGVLLGALILREPSAPGESASAPPTELPWGETSEPPYYVVSIQGAVASPGMYTVEPGVRVGELLQAAEPHSDAELGTVNHAQKLVDGQQIHVLLKGEAPPASGEKAKVSINSATAEELENLPGIGPATARAIVAYREKNGPFAKLEDITNIKGIGPRSLERFIDLIEL